jgi:hypothetical protein
VATITTRAGKGAALTHQEVDANFTGLNTELGQKEVASNKGIANGYASLDSAGKVPSAQLPSYVDDVVEVANFASLPGTGETGKIYVTIDTNKTYRWTGSTYIEISASPGSTDSLAEGSTNLYFTQARARASISASGSLSYNSSTGVMSFSDAVTSVAGRTGAVTLTSSDVGLGNVENKSSATIRGEITSGNVTTALGYTPYNSTNPSGYITSSALSSYLPLSGGTLTGVLVSPTGQFRKSQTAGNYTTAALWTESYDNTATGIAFHISGNVGKFLEMRTNGILYWNGDAVIHGGNYTSYSPTLTGTGASGTWGINITGNAATVSSITSGQVTGALGYTPYNATNPSGYITSSALSSYLPLSGGTLTGTLTVGADGGGANFVQRAVNGWQDVLTVWRGGSNVWNLQDSSGSAKVTSGSFFIGSNLALHAGNYTSYSPSLTGSGASGTWSINVTGTAGATTTVNSSGYGNGTFTWRQESGTFAGQSGWASYLINNHGDGATYYNQTLIMPFWSPPQYSRLEGGTFRGPYVFLSTENYTSYAPSLTGSGASGTWGINVTGTSGSISGYNNPTTAATANTIAYRDGNGDIAAREIVLSSGLSSTTPTVLVSMFPTTNQLVRTTPAAVAESMSAYTVRNRGNVDNFDFNTYGNFSSNIVSGYIESSPNKPTAYAYPYGTTLSFNASPGQAQFYVSHAGNDLAFRGGWNGASWQTWNRVLTNQNYTSYAPSLTGSGASGTWSISVTGSSGSASAINLLGLGSGSVNVDRANTAVYRTESGAGAAIAYAPVLHVGGIDTMWQAQGSYGTSGNGTLYFRQGYAGSWGNWLTMLSSANFGSYALPLSGGNMTGNISGPAYNTPSFIRFASDSNWAYGCSYDGGSQYWMQVQFYGTGDDTRGFRVLNTNGNSVAFRVNGAGNVIAAGNVTAYSDERVKANWRKLDDGFLVNLANVKSGIYDRTDVEITQAGVSAQSLRDVLPEAVIEADNGDLSVAYGNAAMVSAVALAKELVALKQEVAELRARVH